MNISNLPIDESLKIRLTSLLAEFESHRIGNVDLKVEKEEIPPSTTTETKEEKKVDSFFRKFFFSDYL